MKLRLALLLSVIVSVAVAASSANAGKVSASITLDQVSSAGGTLAAQSGPALGDSVTFTTVIPTNVRNPRVEVLCYQNGSLVYGEGGSPTDAFLLGGGASLWLTGGGASSCVANLYYFTWKAGQPATTYLATTSFDAAG